MDEDYCDPIDYDDFIENEDFNEFEIESNNDNDECNIQFDFDDDNDNNGYASDEEFDRDFGLDDFDDVDAFDDDYDNNDGDSAGNDYDDYNNDDQEFDFDVGFDGFDDADGFDDLTYDNVDDDEDGDSDNEDGDGDGEDGDGDEEDGDSDNEDGDSDAEGGDGDEEDGDSDNEDRDGDDSNVFDTNDETEEELTDNDAGKDVEEELLPSTVKKRKRFKNNSQENFTKPKNIKNQYPFSGKLVKQPGLPMFTTNPKKKIKVDPKPRTSAPKKETKADPKPKKSKQLKFPAYLSAQEVADGLKSGELIKGIIRINPKNNRRAYISNENPLEEDYVVDPAEDRNRALEGDVVVIKLKPESEWGKNKKTAVVVHILERIHSRTTVGRLQPFPDNNKQFILFVPRDYRVPKIRIPTNDCPLFYKPPYKYKNSLFKAKITTWNDTKYAVGTILEEIGLAGDLKTETTALLIESDLDIAPFSNELLQDLPVFDAIPPSEFEHREDLRKECIFTIDPLTAHDLDDAVSCKELENGNLEVGVHISDVTYYLTEGTALDKRACKKATTTYLINKAFHMLPQELCQATSLTPGSDKLTFSVIWEMTKLGEIVRHRFARTVMNSCAQLAYEHAQAMINNPIYEFKDDELPEIFGNFTYKDLSKSVNFLHKIAVILRAKRFDQGALKINKTRLIFHLDKDTGEPLEFTVYENKDSNKMIEEFMLLANISVAQKITDAFPQGAFLRRHDPPIKRLLLHWQKTFRMYGIDIDVSSSKALQSSILEIQTNSFVTVDKTEMAVVKHLITKPMVRAQYFYAGDTNSEEDFYHYALHVPMYTHFTSPIRRYADVVVHRLLSASLGYTKKHLWKAKYMSTVASNCNKKKDSANRAQEYSRDLYLAHYIEQHQPFIQDAVVVEVKKNSFDILVVGIGSVIRMFIKPLGDDVTYVQHSKMPKKFVLTLPKTSEHSEVVYVIQLFSVLKVSLFRKLKTRRLEAKLFREVTM